MEDLRFAAFIEHLASVALSDLYPLEPGDQIAMAVLKTISDFSLTRRLEGIELDGVAVCTQYRAASPRKVVETEIAGEERAWTIYMVRAGTGEVDSLLGSGITDLVIDLEPEEEGPPVDEQPGDGLGEGGEPDESARLTAEIVELTGSSDAANASTDLFLACRHRGFHVGRPDPRFVVVGPSLISISMELQAGASIRPIEQATEDLAREVGVPSISVENDPDHPFHVRFLLARQDRVFPGLPSVAAPLCDLESQSYLGFFLGETLTGENFQSWLSAWPHMLVAGTTGSGKTTFLRSLLRQIGAMPTEAIQVAIVDGKGEIDYFNVLEAGYFAPEFPEVLLGHTHALDVLEWVVNAEIPRRRALIVERARATPEGRPPSAREVFTNSLSGTREAPFPALTVFIDEFAEIMLAGRGGNAKRFEQLVQQITQVGRSVLVHLVLATQRPDSVVVAGGIKANLDARVALRLPTHHDSMTILGGKGAETLLGRGDFIFRSAGQAAVRLQGYSA